LGFLQNGLRTKMMSKFGLPTIKNLDWVEWRGEG